MELLAEARRESEQIAAGAEQLAETKKLEADLKLETELLLAEAEAVLVGLFCS